MDVIRTGARTKQSSRVSGEAGGGVNPNWYKNLPRPSGGARKLASASTRVADATVVTAVVAKEVRVRCTKTVAYETYILPLYKYLRDQCGNPDLTLLETGMWDYLNVLPDVYRDAAAKVLEPVCKAGKTKRARDDIDFLAAHAVLHALFLLHKLVPRYLSVATRRLGIAFPPQTSLARFVAPSAISQSKQATIAPMVKECNIALVRMQWFDLVRHLNAICREMIRPPVVFTPLFVLPTAKQLDQYTKTIQSFIKDKKLTEDTKWHKKPYRVGMIAVQHGYLFRLLVGARVQFGTSEPPAPYRVLLVYTALMCTAIALLNLLVDQYNAQPSSQTVTRWQQPDITITDFRTILDKVF